MGSSRYNVLANGINYNYTANIDVLFNKADCYLSATYLFFIVLYGVCIFQLICV